MFPLALLASCAPAITSAADLVATPIWETEAVFKNPESAVFDMERNVVYVSNVDGDPMGRDGHGFISRMSPDGQVTDLEWVTGLNGPKGMAIVGNRLYVADIDTLVEIDIDTGTVSHRYPVPDGQFFNDVAADNAGTVYVSDMMTNRIHRLYNGVFENWIEGSQLENPNGLYATDNKLLVGTWGAMKGGFATEVPGHIKIIDLGSKAVTDFGSDKPIGNMDGIALMADGSIIATDWMAGALMTIAPDGTVRQLLDLNQGSADLEYVMNGSIAIVPMMSDGKVVAYQIAEPAPEPVPEEMPAEGAEPATQQ
jgi:DNA-binding beta-propeller fold protein YncE